MEQVTQHNLSKSENFHQALSTYVKQNNNVNANDVIMRELADALVNDRERFIDLLVYSGVPVDNSTTDIELINKYLNNIHSNRRLLVGSAFLVNQRNRIVGFDGTDEVSDDGVKTSVAVLSSYFSAGHFQDTSPAMTDDFYNAAGVVGSIAGIVQGAAPVATKVMEGQQKKKYGALDLAGKKQDAKQQIISEVLAQKKAQIVAEKKAQEQNAKTTRTLLIVGGILIVFGIGVAVYVSNKNKSS